MRRSAIDQSKVVTSEQLPRRFPREGDTASGEFDDPYRAEFPYVWRALRRLGVAPADIEYLVYDVFVVVDKRLDDYDWRRAIRPWLFGIAFRLASENRRRALGAARDSDAVGRRPTKAPAADDLLESDERRRLVLGCLQVLSLEQRAVLILVDIDGEAPAEVAVSLKIPTPTVYSRLCDTRAASSPLPSGAPSFAKETHEQTDLTAVRPTGVFLRTSRRCSRRSASRRRRPGGAEDRVRARVAASVVVAGAVGIAGTAAPPPPRARR